MSDAFLQLSAGFRGRLIERRFRLDQTKYVGWRPFWKISNGHNLCKRFWCRCVLQHYYNNVCLWRDWIIVIEKTGLCGHGHTGLCGRWETVEKPDCVAIDTRNCVAVERLDHVPVQTVSASAIKTTKYGAVMRDTSSLLSSSSSSSSYNYYFML